LVSFYDLRVQKKVRSLLKSLVVSSELATQI
jgi:hypothetical protein